jgi:hypothetical protein
MCACVKHSHTMQLICGPYAHGPCTQPHAHARGTRPILCLRTKLDLCRSHAVHGPCTTWVYKRGVYLKQGALIGSAHRTQLGLLPMRSTTHPIYSTLTQLMPVIFRRLTRQRKLGDVRACGTTGGAGVQRVIAAICSPCVTATAVFHSTHNAGSDSSQLGASCLHTTHYSAV